MLLASYHEWYFKAWLTDGTKYILFCFWFQVQDNHLLDTPSCIAFLLKLLNPSSLSPSNDKAPTFGSKILGKRKPQNEVSTSYKTLDSTAKTIISKVSEILLTSKEIKSDNKNGEGTERPELSPKWIALLTMEKACLSTVSFEGMLDLQNCSAHLYSLSV